MTQSSGGIELVIAFRAARAVEDEWRLRYPLNSTTHTRVEEPAPDVMHLQARNLIRGMNAYVMHENGNRGLRHQYVSAVNAQHDIIDTLFWAPGDFNKMLKDIFQQVNPDDVAYLLWVSEYRWYRPRPDEDYLNEGKLLGAMVEAELFITIYPRSTTWQELIEIADREKKARDEAWMHPPKEMPELTAIEQSLRKGRRLHAFLSGGGLRVINVKDRKGKTCGYGEHPDVVVALQHANEEYLAGGRTYDEMYGPDGLYTHYLTGKSQPTSNLDWWIRIGNTFDCWQDGDQIVFQLSGTFQYEMPEWVKEQTKRSPGNPVRWSNRGFLYEAEYRNVLFANGEGGHTSRVVRGRKSGSDGWFYKARKTGRGRTFWEAMIAAFEAPEIEVIQGEVE